MAYNSLSREDSVDYDVSSPLARMESLRRDAGAETDTEVTVGSRKRVRGLLNFIHHFVTNATWLNVPADSTCSFIREKRGSITCYHLHLVLSARGVGSCSREFRLFIIPLATILLQPAD